MKLLAFLALFLTAHLQAQVLLRDIGVIGLMSHDIFAWDHKAEINTENGRLDLSTIFDFENGKRWNKGGNPKNEENAPVYTITMGLVQFYKNELKTHSSEVARKKTVMHFHKMVKESFERLSGMNFPQVANKNFVTNTEQGALRALHDILPGRVKLFDRPMRKELVMTNLFTAKTMLNEKELNQEIKGFDGDYDPEYKAIKIPFTKKTINLKEIDGKFIGKYGPYPQYMMLEELADVGKGNLKISDVSFIHFVYDLVSKGMCPLDNQWMPQDVACE